MMSRALARVLVGVPGVPPLGSCCGAPAEVRANPSPGDSKHRTLMSRDATCQGMHSSGGRGAVPDNLSMRGPSTGALWDPVSFSASGEVPSQEQSLSGQGHHRACLLCVRLRAALSVHPTLRNPSLPSQRAPLIRDCTLLVTVEPPQCPWGCVAEPSDVPAACPLLSRRPRRPGPPAQRAAPAPGGAGAGGETAAGG